MCTPEYLHTPRESLPNNHIHSAPLRFARVYVGFSLPFSSLVFATNSRDNRNHLLFLRTILSFNSSPLILFTMPQILQRPAWPPVKSRAPVVCNCGPARPALRQECGFFQLPVEIRIMVYKLVVIASGPIAIFATKDRKVRKLGKRTVSLY
jgi:hypothetical protein